jgi:multiple sugar transport system permease protein
MAVPPVVMIVPLFVLYSQLGLISTYQGTIVIYAGLITPFSVYLLTTFFRTLPRELFEAARMDGDSFWTMFLRIALPIAKPALIVTLIFEFKANWTEFQNALIYLRTDDQFTIPRGLYSLLGVLGPTGGGHGDYQVVIAATVIATIPMIIIFFLGQKQIIQGVSTSGLKG